MKIGSMLKLGVTLAAFAATACVMLAFVYAGTKKIIDIREEADLQAALKDIFPEAQSFEPVEGIASHDHAVIIKSAFKAVRDGKPSGMALILSRAGYAGPITMMVGVSAGGIITGVKILEHSETPGLGANAASKLYFVDHVGITFYGQFAGKNANDSFNVHHDVIAITASTITSAAVASSVKAAGVAVIEWFAATGGDNE